jgi:hypothetical protein
MLTSPHISIRKNVLFSPLFYGAGEICGTLKNDGYDVYHYDLNAALNNIRGSYELTEDDELVLKTAPTLLMNDDNFIKEGNSIFIKWIDELVKIIDIQNYKFIGISLSNRYDWHPESLYVSGIFNFALLLSYKLKKIFPKSKIYMGGKIALRIVSKENFYRAMTFLNLPIDTIFMGNAKDVFPQYLKRNNKHTDLETHIIYRRKNASPHHMKNILNVLAVPPYWNIKNKEDILWDIRSIIPDAVKKEFPVLNEISPFTTVFYSFTHGCRFKCAFCSGGHGRYHTLHVKTVVDAIESIYDQGYDSFTFHNTSINANPSYIVNVCNEIVRRNIKIKFSDSAILNCMTPEVANALSESGCIKLWFGGESGSNRLLKINNKHLTVERIHEKLELSHKAGIWNALNLIVSFPNETEDEFAETKELSRHRYADCFMVNPFGLFLTSEYASNPSKFGVKLRNFTYTQKNMTVADAYDDLNCSWEEKVVQAQERLEEMNEGIIGIKNYIKSSDELLFGISQVMKEKEAKMNFFESLFNNLNREELDQFLSQFKC